MRIITRFGTGGPPINAVLLTTYLDKDRFESLLVAGVVQDGDGDMLYLTKRYNIEPLIIPEIGRNIRLINDFVAFLKLLKLMIREKPDIVHTHTAKAGTLGRMAAILTGVPCIIHTFHGHVLHSYFGKIKTTFFVFVERILGKFTNKIVVISPLQYQEICYNFKIGYPDRFSIIPLGLDLTEFLNADIYKSELRNELSIAQDLFLVGIIGRLTAIKNHELFIKSAVQVLRDIDNVRFVIIGGGELETDLKKLAENMGVQDKFFFLGWRDDMLRIYADLDIIVLTSLNEGTPVTLIEAMACGKAVVATAVGGVPDVVIDGQTGFLVPSGDEQSLAQAVVRLLRDDSERTDFGNRGREIVKGKYTKERLVTDMTMLYEELLNANRHSKG